MKKPEPGHDLQPQEVEPEYDEASIRFLEAVWGKGNLSPGGYDEMDRIVKNIDFDGMDVLDIGCGLGGNAIHLAKIHNLRHITGFDVEQRVVDAANRHVGEAELSAKISIVLGVPGPLPFEEDSFDIVISKDSMIHIPDKDAIFTEIFRVLRPGGRFAASDWLISHDGPASPEMLEYIASEDLNFNMASPARYRQAMSEAGFAELKTENRNKWYREKAREELRQITGPLYDRICADVGTSLVEANIKTWTLMQRVLETGEHCPTHIFGVKPVR